MTARASQSRSLSLGASLGASSKYSAEMHQNTSFYAELNGEHVGEGPMQLQ